MGFYDDMAATSLELLEEFGRSLTHTKKTDGTINALTGLETGATTASQTVVAAVLPASSGKIQGLGKIFSEDLVYKDRQFLLVAPTKADGSALDFLPDPETKFTINGEVYTSAGFTPVDPAGTPVLYKVGVYR